MRLNCPNCDAQYEVPVDVIPAEGRDVQCSSCGITWFQPHPDHAAEPDIDLDIPAPAEEWTPPVEAAEDEATPEAVENSLEETLKQTVREAIPDVVEEVITEEVATQSEDTPLGDFEAELDAQLASGEFHQEWDAPAEPEIETAEDAPTTWETPEPPVAQPAYEEPEPEAEEQEDGFSFTEAADPELAATASLPRGRARRRREVDPAVADILRAEAEHENEVRLAEETSLETQQEFELDSASATDEIAKRAEQARARMARLRGQAEGDTLPDTPEAAGASRRALLPDIEEINSTLRSTEDRAPEERPDGRPSVNQRRRGGRRLGLGLAMILSAILMFIYLSPATIVDRFPESEYYVARYVTTMDDLRLWLDTRMTDLMLWLDGMATDTSSDGS